MTVTDDIDAYLDALPIPALLIGTAERVLAGNRAAVDLFGPGLVGRHYVTALRQPVLLDAIEGSLRSGDRREAAYLAMDGTRDTTWRVTIAPVPTGTLLTLEDRTHIEELGQMRRDFVANVSHELRTPLTALSGFIETLRGAARDDAAARDRFLGIMEREAARMNRLVRDLLSLSRVESEERMRPTRPVDLTGVLRAVVGSLAPLAEDRGVPVTLDLPPMPVTVPGDADQLSQVFTNLLENALKYGGVAVSVRLTVETRSPVLRGAAVRVVVSDEGEGIDPIHLPRLTERFYRADAHRSRELGGTGLGLAIVKHIVNRHRGRLRIHSAPGQGSRFAVILPRPEPDETPQP
ncbi:two-component sensor histidine kinase [Rhodobacteraceae bacterium CCMM004]|nr:two-component sensor histidine kinase [Rhodobacteraceae bacterium CCMM004]